MSTGGGSFIFKYYNKNRKERAKLASFMKKDRRTSIAKRVVPSILFSGHHGRQVLGKIIYELVIKYNIWKRVTIRNKGREICVFLNA